MELKEEEVKYLKMLFKRLEFEIENDIIHCEYGVESLKNKLDKYEEYDNPDLSEKRENQNDFR